MPGKLHNNHGRDHSPWGLDPINAEGFHVITLSDGGFVWYRLIVGRPGNPKQVVEIIVNTGIGGDGDVVATLPLDYVTHLNGQNAPLLGYDTGGVFRPFYVSGATGDIVVGVA